MSNQSSAAAVHGYLSETPLEVVYSCSRAASRALRHDVIRHGDLREPLTVQRAISEAISILFLMLAPYKSMLKKPVDGIGACLQTINAPTPVACLTVVIDKTRCRVTDDKLAAQPSHGG